MKTGKIKRWRAPKARDGQVKLQYGKLPNDTHDICVVWGNGCGKADSRLIMSAFTQKTFRPGTFDSNPSLVEELDRRGYDITTLRFSIEKKKA